MWTCPKCGREFQRTNQGHYCGKAPESVDEYIGLQPEEACAHLKELRAIFLHSFPKAQEKISWSMPVYAMNGKNVSFAACKKHISLYADADVLECFRPQLDGFVIRKNAVYLPYDRELPAEIIESLVKKCFE